MLGIFRKPIVVLKLGAPNWICGRHRTWLDISITGSCNVLIYSDTHPDWKPVSIRSRQVMSGTIVAPIGAKLTIVAKTLLSKTITHFEVDKADWSIYVPKVPEFVVGNVKPANELVQAWRDFNVRLKSAKPIRLRTSIQKIVLKPKFISMRVSKSMFNHREVMSNES